MYASEEIKKRIEERKARILVCNDSKRSYDNFKNKFLVELYELKLQDYIFSKLTKSAYIDLIDSQYDRYLINFPDEKYTKEEFSISNSDDIKLELHFIDSRLDIIECKITAVNKDNESVGISGFINIDKGSIRFANYMKPYKYQGYDEIILGTSDRNKIEILEVIINLITDDIGIRVRSPIDSIIQNFTLVK